jgi:hypothetical protein
VEVWAGVGAWEGVTGVVKEGWEEGWEVGWGAEEAREGRVGGVEGEGGLGVEAGWVVVEAGWAAVVGWVEVGEGRVGVGRWVVGEAAAA